MTQTIDFSLHGERVLLRSWRASDLAPFAALNADADVMRHFPSRLTREDSDALVMRIQTHFIKYGFGPWVLEIPGQIEFGGFVGLLHVSFDAPFTPAVEIGWRLLPQLWGKGYATEAAQLALRYAFEALHLKRVVSFTAPANLASLAVMHRLGMQPALPSEFQHPKLPPGHHLQLHKLFEIRLEEWLSRKA
jgi:ribosomal-protein-alanine N-acetyltransferase